MDKPLHLTLMPHIDHSPSAAGMREDKPHRDFWGFDAQAPTPPCLVESRARAEAQWALFAATAAGAATLGGGGGGGRRAAAMPSSAASNELRQLVRRHGVCPSRRREMWMLWSGAGALATARPAHYRSLVHRAREQRVVAKHQKQFDQVGLRFRPAHCSFWGHEHSHLLTHRHTHRGRCAWF